MELKCPKCQAVFHVDENDYAAILNQVRTAEFDAEIERRMKEYDEKSKFELKSQLSEAKENETNLLASKDKEISDLLIEIERLKGIVENNKSQKEAELAKVSETNAQDLSKLRDEKDSVISKLKLELGLKDQEKELAVSKAKEDLVNQLNQKEKDIIDLNAQLETQKVTSENRIMEINERHTIIIQAKNAEIEHYKDMKERLSTKMLGETLEQHCAIEFDRHQSLGLFPNAEFGKDNDYMVGGTKGDFIFRDYKDDFEYISIMFEMKNEADNSATKQKNHQFFEKLHKDRCEKNCEYAILVSMLERDDDRYNAGIYCVPQYEKMYVIRPQMFIPIISILSRNAQHSLNQIQDLRQKLSIAQAQFVDVTDFEEKRNKFGEEFKKFVDKALGKHQDAIDDFDKAINNLEKQISLLRGVRSKFEDSDKFFNKASDKFENDFTIKKLTRGNNTMKAMFEEAQKSKSQDLLSI